MPCRAAAHRAAAALSLLAAQLLAPFAAGVAQPVFSGTQYTVTTLVDEDNGNLADTNGTGTSLREAVKYSASGDRIVFGSVTGSAFLTLGDLFVDHGLIINGPSIASIEINGNDNSGRRSLAACTCTCCVRPTVTSNRR